jgi:O-antigen ligase
VRFSIGGIPTTVLEIMIYILFLVWIINKIQKQYHLSFPRRRESIATLKLTINIIRNSSALNIGIILLFLGLTISTFNSSDTRTSLGIFKGWFVDPFLFFIVFVSVIKKEKHIISALKNWIFSGVAVSLISIFYLLNNDLTFDGRLKAFFLSPNHLAMYISPVFLILLFFLLNGLSFPRRRESIATINNSLRIVQNIKKISNIQYPIFLIIIFVPLYFTYSYGAFLGIFAAIIYLLIFRTKSTRALWNPILNIKPACRTGRYLILLIIISIFIIFISLGKFDQVINSNERSSFHSRLMIWNASVEIIKDNPFFGIGPGTFQNVYLSYAEKFDKQYLEWAVPQPHNIFLAFYLQTGFIGFIGFILILFWFFNGRRSRALGTMSPTSNIINIITNALIIYILIHGFIDTTYWKNDLSLMFWLVIGMKVVLRI